MRTIKLPSRRLLPRRLLWLQSLQALSGLAIIAGFFVLGAPVSWKIRAGLGLIFGGTFCYFGFQMWFKHLANRARTHGLCLCPRCAKSYEVASAGQHECAHCRFTFDTQNAKTRWRAVVLRVPTRKTGPTPVKYKPTTSIVVIAVYTVWIVALMWLGQIVVSNLPNLVTITGIFWLLSLSAPALFFTFRDRKQLQHLKKLAKEASECDFLMCTTCQYRLNDLPEAAQCPECGSEIDRHDTRRRWFEVYGYYFTERAATMDIPLEHAPKKI